MKKKQLKKLYIMIQSKLLSRFPEIKHFFLDKNDGNFLIENRINLDSLITVKQVHGNSISLYSNLTHFEKDNQDGIISKKRVFLAVRTADCIPMLIYENKKRIIGAIHAGWKGLYKGIISKTLTKIYELDGNKKNIIIAIGPHIQKCCYNVLISRIRKFKKLVKDEKLFCKMSDASWFIDLGKIASIQLKNAGIPEKNIEISTICTYCHSDYFSVRRDGPETGRMLNIIGLV